MTSRRRKTRDDERSTTGRPLQPPVSQSSVAPNTALQVPAGRRLLGQDVLQLQRSLGNRAVAHLLARSLPAAVQARRESVVHKASRATVQRRKGGEKASRSKLLILVKHTLEYARKKGDKGVIRDLTQFLKTGQLTVRTLGAAVMPRRSLLGRRVALLKRGYAVQALGLAGPWIQVRTLDGKGGWMHRWHLLPQIIILRSGETGSGSTRDDARAIGGRG